MKKLLILLVVSITLILTSCNVNLFPPSSPTAISAIFKLDTASHNLFENIKASDNKNYYVFQSEYADLDSQINVILVSDSSRPHNKGILVLANDIKSLITKYENQHQSQQILNNVEADINEDELHEKITSLENAEQNFN